MAKYSSQTIWSVRLASLKNYFKFVEFYGSCSVLDLFVELFWGF